MGRPLFGSDLDPFSMTMKGDSQVGSDYAARHVRVCYPGRSGSAVNYASEVCWLPSLLLPFAFLL
jgi:hypothetical protein